MFATVLIVSDYDDHKVREHLEETQMWDEGKLFLPLVDWSYESCSAHSLVEEFKRWGRKSRTDLLFSVVHLKHVCIKTLEVSAKQSDDFYCQRENFENKILRQKYSVLIKYTN